MKVITTNDPYIAKSFRFFWIKRVYVGSVYRSLTPRQREAVVTHEVAHIGGHDTLWRMLALLFPPVMPWLCRRQEFAADAFAKDRGYGPPLIEVLRTLPEDCGWLYPKTSQRIEKLLHN